jgi:hypothetical protein
MGIILQRSRDTEALGRVREWEAEIEPLSLEELHLLASVAEALRPVDIALPTPSSTARVEKLLARGMVREVKRADGGVTLEITERGLEEADL